jgi:hypothetical protein
VSDGADFLAFLNTLYGPWASSVPESSIEQAERRLGRPLPAALSRLYRERGACAPGQTYNRLLAPADLILAGGHLVFCEENQAVVSWGIAEGDLGQSDPPVHQGQTDGTRWEFFPEFPSLTDFVRWQGALEGISGALPELGTRPSRQLSRLTGETFRTLDACVWVFAGAVLVVDHAETGLASLGASTVEAFQGADRSLGLSGEWNR